MRKTQDKTSIRSEQKRLDDFEQFKPFFERFNEIVKQYEAKKEQLRKANKNKKEEQKKLVFSKEVKKGSGCMNNYQLEVEYLKDGKKRIEILKSSREQVEFWNLARKGEITVICAHKKEEIKKGA